jgi:hypothetical protein
MQGYMVASGIFFIVKDGSEFVEEINKAFYNGHSIPPRFRKFVRRDEVPLHELPRILKANAWACERERRGVALIRLALESGYIVNKKILLFALRESFGVPVFYKRMLYSIPPRFLLSSTIEFQEYPAHPSFPIPKGTPARDRVRVIVKDGPTTFEEVYVASRWLVKRGDLKRLPGLIKSASQQLSQEDISEALPRKYSHMAEGVKAEVAVKAVVAEKEYIKR